MSAVGGLAYVLACAAASLAGGVGFAVAAYGIEDSSLPMAGAGIAVFGLATVWLLRL
jgi:hypothetical protein